MNAIGIARALRAAHLWPLRFRAKTARKYALQATKQPGPDTRSPVLLGCRLTALQLNPKAIERLAPAVLDNLRSTCALCTEKRRCLEDMMEHLNPPGWEGYCPNSGKIRTFALTAIAGACRTSSAPLGDQ
jgi:hypothetical protein